jgi:Holliday junction resolvase
MASKQQTKLINKLKAKAWKVLNVIRLGENGYPDLLCLKQGEVIWVESKEKQDTLSPLQALRIKELRSEGFKVFIEKDGEFSELEKYLSNN